MQTHDSSIADHAIEILQQTHDGNDLAPQHLKLVEMAVNGILNEAGRAAFNALFLNVRAGYTPPWFHNVKHLTRDHEGYVRWKGTPIEHFSSDYAHSNDAKTYANELARRCLLLELQGIEPNTNRVVWQWPDDELKGAPLAPR